MLLRQSTLLLAVAVSLLLAGCDLLGGNDDSNSSVATSAVYVANQGNFGDGNGSVTFFDPDREESRPTAISGLSSTVQGISVRDTSLLIMANSAARIDVFSTDGPTQTAQLTDLSGPRYATFPNENTAYVTDQVFGGSSAVHVLDLSSPQPQIVSSISVSGTPEDVTSTDDRVYASLGAFGDTTLVAAIDVTQNTVENIDVGCPSRSLAVDGDGEIFVACSNTAEAVIVDGATGTVRTRLPLPDTAETAFSVGRPLSYAPEAEELYVATDTGILRIDTATNTVATMLDVDTTTPIGAVGYDAVRQDLYVARVPGFTERGTVTIHDRNGEQKGSFQAGIAPTYIDVRRIEE